MKKSKQVKLYFRVLVAALILFILFPIILVIMLGNVIYETLKGA